MSTHPANGRTRIKICGITRAEDAVCAAYLGADAIGLVFYEPSPRYVSIEQAVRIVAAVPPFVTVVALFFDARQADVEAVLEHVPVDLLQFHSEETPEFCAGFDRPYIKAVRIREGVDVHAQADRYQGARALLLDNYQAGAAGGTGTTFDWSQVPRDIGKPVILAGGLAPENVCDAIRLVHPYAVDVSSGVEQGRGVKDSAKIAAFIRSVHDVDSSARANS